MDLLTADTLWNPDIVDEEFFSNSLQSLYDVPHVQARHDAHDLHIVPFRELYVTSITHTNDSIAQEQFVYAIEQLIAAPQHMKRRLPNLDALLPNFSWVGKEHIHDMLSKTTQHYVVDQRVPMRKYFCSCFPGANVWQLPEWFATDTFIVTRFYPKFKNPSGLVLM